MTSGGVAAVQVNFSGDICNTGQTPLTGVTVTDNPSATITPSTIPTLAPAGQTGECVKYSGHYLPSGVTPGDLGGVAGRYIFSDEIKVTGATAEFGDSPGADGTCVSPFIPVPRHVPIKPALYVLRALAKTKEARSARSCLIIIAIS